MSRPVISLRAALVAVLVALLAGVLVSLAIRPPGSGAAVATGGSAGDDGAQVRWRMPVSISTRLPVFGETVLYFAEALRRVSAGRVELTPFEPGELVPALSVTDAVRDRKVDVGFTWLAYDQGRIPAAPLIASVPFGMEPWEFMGWWYVGGGQAMGEALYREHGIHPILCGIIGPETAGWFREPVESIEDIQGLKIRFSGLGGKVLQELGASVTTIPGTEIFQALEKGAIDATEFSQPVVDQLLGFDRIARFNYFPGWHQPSSATHLVVNLDAWQELDDATRGLLDVACAATTAYGLALSEAAQGPVIDGFRESGVSVSVLPPELLDRLKAATDVVLTREAAANDDFARILASQQAFSGTYRTWKRLGYLPRDF